MSDNTTPDRSIVMLGNSPDAPGGMASVIKVYIESGLFDRWRITYLSTFKDGPFAGKLLMAIKAFILFVSLLVRRRVTLAHIHSASRGSFWRKAVFAMAARMARVPVIFHLHGASFNVFYHDESGAAQKRVIRFVLDRMTRIIALSATWKADLGKITSNKNVSVIFNPVILPPAPARHDNTDANQMILFLGRLGVRKGSFDLLEAFRITLDTHPEAKLVMGGDGDIEGAKTLARKLGVADSVLFPGWIGADQRELLFAEACVYTLPSYHEGLPMGILEAMAAGLPVVSTCVGGIPEAVENGVEGYIVEPGAVARLADALSSLLSDANLRMRMGRAAREKVENSFSASRTLPKLENLYRELGAAPRSD